MSYFLIIHDVDTSNAMYLSSFIFNSYNMRTQIINRKVFEGIWVATEGNSVARNKILQRTHALKQILWASWELFKGERSFYLGVPNMGGQALQNKAIYLATETLLQNIIDSLTCSRFIYRSLLVNGLFQVCNNLKVSFHHELASAVDELIKGNIFVSSLSSYNDYVIFTNTNNESLQFRYMYEEYINLLHASKVF